jgi:hypothetical protein
MENWQKQLDELKIPYPQKHHLFSEIAEHLSHFPNENSDVFNSDSLSDLFCIHNTRFLKFLAGLSSQTRSIVEFFFAGGPLLALLIYLTTEGFMLNFIKEGGAGMWVILGIGILLFIREALLFFRVVVIKDHSKEYLSIDTMNVVASSIALVLLGIGASALGAYSSAAIYVRNEDLPVKILIVGLSESITCLVMSTSFAALILLLNLFIRQVLITWKVPLNKL